MPVAQVMINAVVGGPFHMSTPSNLTAAKLSNTLGSLLEFAVSSYPHGSYTC